DRANKGEIARPVAAVEIVEKDPAGAARFAAMRQIEILVAPRLETLVAFGVVAGAGGLQRGVEFPGGLLVGIDRSEVGAAAEPGFAGYDMARVHVDRWHQRRAHMRDQRHAARPE